MFLKPCKTAPCSHQMAGIAPMLLQHSGYRVYPPVYSLQAKSIQYFPLALHFSIGPEKRGRIFSQSPKRVLVTDVRTLLLYLNRHTVGKRASYNVAIDTWPLHILPSRYLSRWSGVILRMTPASNTALSKVSNW